MTRSVLLFIPIAMVLSWILTLAVRAASRRMGAFDSAGVAGQVKAPRRKVPNTGGIAIFWTIAGLMLGGLGAAWSDGAVRSLEDVLGSPGAIATHVAGIRDQTPLALMLLGSLAMLHILGLVDDRKPLGPWIKCAIMFAPAIAIPVFTDTRLLTLLDGPAGGRWLSIAVTALWFVAITNAMNFMDNMDGLSVGSAVIASACFLAATLVSSQPQWFVAACLALMVGTGLGFLTLNFPIRGRASIYMGDSGSLVLGFLLAFLTTRTTYVETPVGIAGEAGMPGHAWYAVLMPPVVLAIPLYDFASVVILRLKQGKSPFVGDTQHFSHRLVQLGLTSKAAVMVIWGLTGITGTAGIMLTRLHGSIALVAGLQVFLALGVLALFEWSSRGTRAEMSRP